MKDKMTASQLISQGVLRDSFKNMSLLTFIDHLDSAINEEKLQIINGPDLVTASQIMEAKKEIQDQEQYMQKWGKLCGSTKGLVHLLQIPNSNNNWQVLNTQAVCNYYKQQAEMIMKRKKCTCDGLAAVAFELAKNMLTKHSINNLKIDLCNLRNFSHTLLHLMQTKQDGKVDHLFYDPWYQRCYCDTPTNPKVFPDDRLGIEIANLITKTPMIKLTESFVDLESGKIVINSQRDYAYFITCSNKEFTNPAVQIADPTIIQQYFCVIV